MHGNLAAALMIFGLVIFTKSKQRSPSFVIMSVVHCAMAHLIFVDKVGKSGRDMWLRGAD